MLWKLVGNWQQKRMVDLSELGSHWPVSSKQGNCPDEQAAKTLLRWGAITSVLLRKGGNIPYGSVPPWGSKSNKRHLTSLDLKAKVVRLGDGWQVSSRSTASLDCLLSKWFNSRSALPTLRCQSTIISNELRQWWTRAKHYKLRVDHHLWGHWTFIRTSLFLSQNWHLASE